MANDITIPATGTGTATPVVATEDIASSHYQVMKLAAGTAASTAKLGQIDDAAFTPGTSAVLPIAAEFDDTSPDSVDEGDGGALRMSSRRELYTQIRDAAGNERGVNVSAQNAAAVAGDVAHDAADNGLPQKIGAKATSSLSGLTPVATADRTDLFAGTDGVLITRPHTNLEDIAQGVVAITDGSSTSCIAAGGASVKYYVSSVVVANSSASNVTVDIRDGTAGSVKLTLPVPANGGVIFTPPVPLGGFTANTAIAVDPSAAASTITTTIIAFKSKV